VSRGKLVFIRERTQAGLKSARSRGKVGGRPKALTAKEVQALKSMAADASLTVADNWIVSGNLWVE
jgi:DNA invertase Pin-like site-specific DNA recombinase